MKAKTSKEVVKELLGQLTEDEREILRDTIIYGGWGDTIVNFTTGAGENVEVYAYGYCTNDAQEGGRYIGRRNNQLFKSIYRKLCPNSHGGAGTGEYIAHCSDWWGDGSGDMLFIRTGIYQEMEAWARGENIY